MPVPDSQAVSAGLPAEEIEVEEQAPAEGSASDQPQTEETFTRAQVEAMLADFEEKTVKPLIQSQVAKSENRTAEKVSSQIRDRFAELEKNKGVLKLSEEQVVEAKKAIVEEETMRAYEPEGVQGKQTPAAAADLETYARFVDDQIDAVLSQNGVEITPADPEYKIIQAAYKDPNGNLSATIIAAHTAATAKAARLKSLKGNAPARAGVGGGTGNSGNNISGITDPKELYKLGEREINKR